MDLLIFEAAPVCLAYVGSSSPHPRVIPEAISTWRSVIGPYYAIRGLNVLCLHVIIWIMTHEVFCVLNLRECWHLINTCWRFCLSAEGVYFALIGIRKRATWCKSCFCPTPNLNFLIVQVNVTMPAFFFDSEEYLSGIVVGNFTSGGPVHGNLTLVATVRPIDARLYPALRQDLYSHAVIQQFIPTVSALCPRNLYRKWQLELWR